MVNVWLINLTKRDGKVSKEQKLFHKRYGILFRDIRCIDNFNHLMLVVFLLIVYNSEGKSTASLFEFLSK